MELQIQENYMNSLSKQEIMKMILSHLTPRPLGCIPEMVICLVSVCHTSQNMERI